LLACIPAHTLHFLCLVIRRARRSTLFPYTTLFRSRRQCRKGNTDFRYDSCDDELLLACRFHSLDELFVVPGIDLSMTSDVRRFGDRKSTRLNSSHVKISYAVFCLKKKKHNYTTRSR